MALSRRVDETPFSCCWRRGHWWIAALNRLRPCLRHPAIKGPMSERYSQEPKQKDTQSVTFGNREGFLSKQRYSLPYALTLTRPVLTVTYQFPILKSPFSPLHTLQHSRMLSRCLLKNKHALVCQSQQNQSNIQWSQRISSKSVMLRQNQMSSVGFLERSAP